MLACSLLAAFAFAAGGREAAASPRDDAVATVRAFINAFNGTDPNKVYALCANPVAIVDEFPPHAWQGPRACQQWLADYNADAKKNGISDGFVTMGSAWDADVSGDRAYVVAPTTYAYKQHGKQVKELHSVFTVALMKSGGKWLVTGWAWSKH